MRRVHTKLERDTVFVKLRSPRGMIRYLLQEHDVKLLAGALIADPATAARLLSIYRALDEGRDPELDHIPARFLPDYLVSPGESISLEGMPVAVNISSGMTAHRRTLILSQEKSAILGGYLDHLFLAFDGVAPNSISAILSAKTPQATFRFSCSVARWMAEPTLRASAKRFPG